MVCPCGDLLWIAIILAELLEQQSQQSKCVDCYYAGADCFNSKQCLDTHGSRQRAQLPVYKVNSKIQTLNSVYVVSLQGESWLSKVKTTRSLHLCFTCQHLFEIYYLLLTPGITAPGLIKKEKNFLFRVRFMWQSTSSPWTVTTTYTLLNQLIFPHMASTGRCALSWQFINNT